MSKLFNLPPFIDIIKVPALEGVRFINQRSTMASKNAYDGIRHEDNPWFESGIKDGTPRSKSEAHLTLPQHGGAKPLCIARFAVFSCRPILPLIDSPAVVRVHGAPGRAKDTAAYVEIKLAESVRKTGILNDEGEPLWNGTITFLHPGASAVLDARLKKVRKVGRDDLVGQAEVNVDELLANSIRAALFAPTSFRSSRKRPSSIGSIHLHLKRVDALNRAKIEIETAEKSTKGIRTLTNKTDSTMEVIGTVIEATDVIIDIVDKIAQIHPLFNVSWQATSALYKLVSQQLHTDSELIDLVGKMKKSFDFSKETSGLDDKTKMLKPIVKDLLSETAECSRFVQEYAKHGLMGRMNKLGSRQKIRNYSTRFVERRNELDSVIGLNTAKEVKEVLDINLQQQLEVLLDPSKSDHSSVSKRPRCLGGTRQEYLDPIMEFLFAETSPNILWLTGAAGSGKSTIAVTAFEKCGAKKCSPAYMFFEREKSDPSSVIRTIACMLASHYPSVAPHIFDALESNKTICAIAIKNQFEKLLLEPLQAFPNSVKGPIVIVLDALDECGSVEQRRELLQMLKTGFTELPSKVRVLVTSRPEGDMMEGLPRNDRIRHIELDHTTEGSRHDVDLFIQQEMAKALGKQVSKGNLRVLCDAADGLFIWASTAVKMVQGAVKPRRSLEKLVNDIRSVGSNGIDSLYATVLKGSGIWDDNSDSKDEGMAVLGIILVAKEAMTGTVIESFLGLEEDTVDSVLRRLRSVVSYEPGKPIRLHHASFADYLLSSQSSGDEAWHVDEVVQKQAVTERCFDIMAKELHFNMCDLESSFVLNRDIPDLQTRIANNIRPELDYACRFWGVHLCELSKSDVSTGLKDRMKTFGNEHLLYWFEVLSMTGQFNRVAIRALYDASMWSASIDEEMYSLFWAAYRLGSVFAYPISQSAPHIYLSAISLWKGESLVADYYSKSHPVVKVDRLGARTPGQCIKVLGHESIVSSVAVSADGDRIASGYRDGTTRVWSTFSGELIQGPFEADSEVLSVAFSSGGKQVVSGSERGKIHIWDVDTGSVVSVFNINAGDSKVTSVAFSPDSRRIISVSDRKVYYYENGELVPAQIEDDMDEDNTGENDTDEDDMNEDDSEFVSVHDKDVDFREVTADGKYVLRYKNSMIGIWDASTGKQVSAPFNVGDAVLMTVSSDGKLLMTVSVEGLCIWNVDSGELAQKLSDDEHLVYSLAFSADVKRVVLAGYGISIWDVDSGQRIWGPFEGHTTWITSVIFTPDGKRVISASKDSIRIWDVDGSTEIASGGFEAHTDTIRSVAYSADGKRIVSGSDDNTIRVWDADSGKHLTGPFKGHTDGVLSVSFSPDGKRVLSGSEDGTIRIWNAESGELLAGPFEAHVEGAGCTRTGDDGEHSTETHRCPVYSVAFSPNGKHLVSPSCNNTICIRNADSGRLVLGPFKGHTGRVNSVGYSPDGKRVVSGSRNTTICIWDADSGKLVLDPLEGHTAPVLSVAFSPNGKRVASGSRDNTICIWDAGTGNLISGPLKGHTSRVTSVCFSPDGKWVVSGSDDETICIWDADTGKLIWDPLEGHTSIVLSVAISPDADGMRIVSGSADNTIRVWDVLNEDIVPGCGRRLAKRTVTTSLSSHPADTHTGLNDQDTVPAASRERTLLNWTLSKDGWVKGEGGELLTWIPEDMRGVLWLPRNTAFIGQFSMKLDLLNSSLGESWAKGYPK
ncbi:hypothetical protein ACEPAG_7428 [Sanghuangporus baumii]